MAAYENALWFLAGAALIWLIRPGWRFTIRKNGMWVWEVSRIPCKNCPLATAKKGGA